MILNNLGFVFILVGFELVSPVSMSPI